MIIWLIFFFQNTGSFYNIALTRRYDSNNVVSNKANFCIQTGASGTIDGLPVRLCIRNDGKVNIGSSQTKTAGFNVDIHVPIDTQLEVQNPNKFVSFNDF